MTERRFILSQFSQSERDHWEKLFGEPFPIKGPPQPAPYWRVPRIAWTPSQARLRELAAQKRREDARKAAKAKFAKATGARLAAVARKLEEDIDLAARVAGHAQRIAAERGREGVGQTFVRKAV